MAQEEKAKKPAQRKTPTQKPKATKKPASVSNKPKESWVHVDYYLMTLDARDEVKQGFRIYMRRDAYQTSYEAFDEHFEKFKKRKINGGAR